MKVIVRPSQHIQRAARHAQNIISPDRRRIKEMPGNCIIRACQHQNPGKPFCQGTGIFTACINDFEDFLQRCHTQQPLPRFRNGKSPLFVTKWNFVTKQSGSSFAIIGSQSKRPNNCSSNSKFQRKSGLPWRLFLDKIFLLQPRLPLRLLSAVYKLHTRLL